MDTYENDNLENEFNQEHTEPATRMPGLNEEPVPQPQEQPTAQCYSNAGVGRKESPFADSPYVMNHQNAYSADPPKKQKKAKKQGGGKVRKGIIAAVLAVALVGGSCAVTALTVNSYWSNKTAQLESSMNQKIADLQKRMESAGESASSNGGSNVIVGDAVSSQNGLTPSQVYAMNVNSVVAISNQATTNIYGQVTETASSGSGFIISEDGYVVSNYHVVEGADTLTVITYDGKEYPAELVGYDESNDVSLMKIDAAGLDPVAIGSSDELIVGDQVVAIGNPLGELTSTLTVGYISAKDRTINTDGTYNINMMQTDAAINSGNSGVPLFNMRGEVVGITTAKYSGSSNSGATIEGIGFAIPMDDVIGMLDDLREYGYVKGAYLGVSVISMDASVAEAYGLPTGSKVSVVEPESCAAKAGIQVGDIITGMGGYDVTGNSDLLSILRKFEAGDTTTITVYRGGQEIDLTITLDEKPAPVEEEETAEDPTLPSGSGEMPSEGSAEDWFNFYAPFFGFGSR